MQWTEIEPQGQFGDESGQHAFQVDGEYGIAGTRGDWWIIYAAGGERVNARIYPTAQAAMNAADRLAE